jgi:Putative Ig domain
MRFAAGARSLLVLGVVLVGGSLTACGDDSSASSASADATTGSGSSAGVTAGSGSTTGAITRTGTPVAALSIAGAPANTVVAGQPYSFKPVVTAAVGATLSFVVANLPSWAKFDPTSGTISGTPTASQVGNYPNITITVKAGSQTSALTAFAITVAAADSSSDNVTLSWVPPTVNADGTPLTDLKGFKVHYGAASKTYSDTIEVANPGLTTYVVENLTSGKYYFAVTAYNSKGAESAFSPEISTTVD